MSYDCTVKCDSFTDEYLAIERDKDATLSSRKAAHAALKAKYADHDLTGQCNFLPEHQKRPRKEVSQLTNPIQFARKDGTTISDMDQDEVCRRVEGKPYVCMDTQAQWIHSRMAEFGVTVPIELIDAVQLFAHEHEAYQGIVSVDDVFDEFVYFVNSKIDGVDSTEWDKFKLKVGTSVGILDDNLST